MTRSEAKEQFKNDIDSYGKPKKIMTKINKIYDDFETILKEKNNEIARLRKELAKGHNINCDCSFCQMVED